MPLIYGAEFWEPPRIGKVLLRMSAIGTKRTSACALHMSAFGGKADMAVLHCTCLLLTQSGHHLGLGSNSIPVRAYGMLGLRANPELLPWLNLKWLSIARGIKLGGLEGAQTQELALGFVGSSWIPTQYRTRPTFR